MIIRSDDDDLEKDDQIRYLRIVRSWPPSWEQGGEGRNRCSLV